MWPEPREDSSMIHYQDTKNLLLFGGWINELIVDIHGIYILAIVGSSYSCQINLPK